MAVTDLQTWADNLELVRLPAIESDISDLTASQALYDGQLNAKAQELNDRLDAQSVRITAAKTDATSAYSNANLALTTIYGVDLDATTYTNQKFQEAQNEINARFDALQLYLDGDYAAFVDTKIGSEKSAFQSAVDAAVADALQARDSLNTELSDMELINNDILNVHFPDVYQQLSSVENRATDFEAELNTAFAGFGYTSVSEGLDALRASSINDIAAIRHENLRLPASLWTNSSTSAVAGIKSPASESNFTTSDTAFGDAYAFTQGVDETIGLAKPVTFDPNRIYKITVRFRVTNEGTSGGVKSRLGVSTWDQNTLTAQNVEKELTSVPVAIANGIVKYSAFFSDNLTRLQDLEFVIGNSDTDEAVHINSTGTPTTALFHFRQNPNLVTNGQAVVDTFQIEDVTEIFDAFSNLSGGVSTYHISVYKRSSSTNPAKPVGGSYSFATKTLGVPTGWNEEIPSGTDPVFVSHALASAPGTEGVDQNLTWSDSVLLVKNGLNAKSVYAATIYKRDTGAPNAPFGGSFDFGTNTLTVPTGWSEEVPNGDNPLYATNYVFSVIGDTATDSAGNWSAPGKIAEDGVPGDPGLSTFTGYVYQRAVNRPGTPSGGSYNFGTNVLNPPFGGWRVNVPVDDGNPIWVTTATTSTTGVSGTSTFGTWEKPEILAKNGEAGDDAPLVRLESDGNVFRFDANGVSVGQSVIDFNATLYNTSGTVNWTVDPVMPLTSITGGKRLSVSDFGSNTKATITADVGGTVSDRITVYRIEDGATGATGESGYTVVQSNESHVFPANANGTVTDFSGSGTTFSVFYGSDELLFDRYSAGAGEFEITNVVNGPGVTGSTSTDLNNGGFIAEITGLANDTGYRDITVAAKGNAETSAVSFTKRQSFAKSKEGGIGPEGDNARSVRIEIQSGKTVFSYNTSGANPSPTSCSLVSKVTNSTGVLSYQWNVNSTLVTASSSYTYVPAASYSNMSELIELIVFEDGNEIGRDYLTMVGVQDGNDAILVHMENASHTVPADSSGAVIDYSNSGGKLRVFEGNEELTYAVPNPTAQAGEWYVSSKSSEPTTMTIGNILDFGVYGLVEDHSSMANAVNNYVIKYWITGKRKNGSDFTREIQQTVTKSKFGTNGDKGNTVITGMVYYQILQPNAPTTNPSATEYDTTTGTFTDINTNWSKSQPAVDITDTALQEWSSEFSVVIDGETGVQSIDFTVPTGAIQIGSDLQSDNWNPAADPPTGWQIQRASGNAEFNNITARGRVESYNFETGVSGWQIKEDGTAEFDAAAIRGELKAPQIDTTDLAADAGFVDDLTVKKLSAGTTSSGLRVNTAGYENAVYAYQDIDNIYGLFAENTALGGGAVKVESNGGFTTQIINTNAGSGAFGAYVGLDVQNSGINGGAGQAGLSNDGGGYAFNAISGGYYDSSGSGYLPFTGCHDGMIHKSEQCVLGDIMVDDVVVSVGLNDAFTELKASTSVNEKGSVGVLSRVFKKWYTPAAFIDHEASEGEKKKKTKTKKSKNNRHKANSPEVSPVVKKHELSEFSKSYNLVHINSVGEGAINVCGRGGDLEKGDLITTSDIVGKGQKQADDILRNYTVAKSREPVTFSSPDEVKMIACIYLCG